MADERKYQSINGSNPNLEGTTTVLQDQLRKLRAEVERLEREVGSWIERFGSLDKQLASCAAGPWVEGEPPKENFVKYLVKYLGGYAVVYWHKGGWKENGAYRDITILYHAPFNPPTERKET